jgi:hypothetical protein
VTGDDITVTVTLPREQAQAFVELWNDTFPTLPGDPTPISNAVGMVARALADALGEDG